MRRMNLDEPNAETDDLLHVGHHILRVPRMDAAARKQPLRIFLHVTRDPLIHRRSKPDHLGRDVVDEHRAIDSGGIKMFEKSSSANCRTRQSARSWRACVFIAASASGLNISTRLNVHVAVGDQKALLVLPFSCAEQGQHSRGSLR